METRILVPLDGSRLAEQALSCAMTLGTRAASRTRPVPRRFDSI